MIYETQRDRPAIYTDADNQVWQAPPHKSYAFYWGRLVGSITRGLLNPRLEKRVHYCSLRVIAERGGYSLQFQVCSSQFFSLKEAAAWVTEQKNIHEPLLADWINAGNDPGDYTKAE